MVKNIFLALSLCGALLSPVYAETAAAVVSTPAPALAAAASAPHALVAAPATADAGPAASDPPTPTVHKGDAAWMIVATLLVIMMAVPGLPLFYGGMVRSKNMLSVMMQVLVTFSLLGMLWCVYGYSLAFTEGNAFFGGFEKLFLKGVTVDSLAATFSKGVAVPEFLYIAFQMTFAAITPALIIGAVAERAKFSALLLFMVLWFTFSYLPLAHMVWYWAGPDAYINADAADKAMATAGFLFQKGAIDFAGGTVVHINAAMAGLVGAYMLGKRVGFGKEQMAPHNLTMTMVGASLLWVGWFGFNVGSNLEASGTAGLAFLNTFLAACAATVSWTLVEWKVKTKPSMLGAASGAIAGLVAITPACGFVGVMGSMVIGLSAGAVCYWGVNGLKRLLKVDDSLDVFGVHGVGGILGALLTGVFASPDLGGTGVYDYVTNAVGEYHMGRQLVSQLWGVCVAVVWSTVVSVMAFKIADWTLGLRVTEDDEREGLDLTSHGERAYHL
ncbi:MAG: ammonium transporter [Burkholderiaceae bacterium]|nr:ammonium transporter [Burkholderiaceae bacterium]